MAMTSAIPSGPLVRDPFSRYSSIEKMLYAPQRVSICCAADARHVVELLDSLLTHDTVLRFFCRAIDVCICGRRPRESNYPDD